MDDEKRYISQCELGTLVGFDEDGVTTMVYMDMLDEEGDVFSAVFTLETAAQLRNGFQMICQDNNC